MAGVSKDGLTDYKALEALLGLLQKADHYTQHAAFLKVIKSSVIKKTVKSAHSVVPGGELAKDIGPAQALGAVQAILVDHAYILRIKRLTTLVERISDTSDTMEPSLVPAFLTSLSNCMESGDNLTDKAKAHAIVKLFVLFSTALAEAKQNVASDMGAIEARCLDLMKAMGLVPKEEKSTGPVSQFFIRLLNSEEFKKAFLLQSLATDGRDSVSTESPFSVGGSPSSVDGGAEVPTAAQRLELLAMAQQQASQAERLPQMSNLIDLIDEVLLPAYRLASEGVKAEAFRIAWMNQLSLLETEKPSIEQSRIKFGLAEALVAVLKDKKSQTSLIPGISDEDYGQLLTFAQAQVQHFERQANPPTVAPKPAKTVRPDVARAPSPVTAQQVFPAAKSTSAAASAVAPTAANTTAAPQRNPLGAGNPSKPSAFSKTEAALAEAAAAAARNRAGAPVAAPTHEPVEAAAKPKPAGDEEAPSADVAARGAVTDARRRAERLKNVAEGAQQTHGSMKLPGGVRRLQAPWRPPPPRRRHRGPVK